MPLLGDTRGYGLALDAHGPRGAPSNASGPGRAGALDMWLNSNAFWSCLDASHPLCAAGNIDEEVRACCTGLALGGVSLLFTPTFPAAALTNFTAYQRIAIGELATAWATPLGGRISTSTRMATDGSHAAATTVTYSPGSGEPPALVMDVAVWVISDAAPCCPNGPRVLADPAPVAVGCADSAGAPQPCAAAAAAATYATRAAATTPNASSVMPVLGAVAACVDPPAAVLWRAVTAGGNETLRGLNWEATTRVRIPAGSSVVIVSALEVTHGAGAPDPAPRAVAAAAGTNGSAAAASADAFWGAWWASSGVDLPGEPGVASMFNGNAYALAAFSGFGDDDVPPGLYGPWASIDQPAWSGDYTLDYNYNAAYFGAFASGHGEAAAAAFRPILDYLPAARRKAQGQARRANLTFCPPTALYYGCHLTPWGTSSTIQFHMPTYMAWNGNYAALLFLDRWEYWADAGFAAGALWPLLDGLNAWWGCYLNRTATGLPPPADFVYNDANAANPDMEHERQPVPNPQIGMAFIRRGLDAQVALAAALGLPLPPAVAAMARQLAPLNSVQAAVPAPAGAWSAPLPDTRCHAPAEGGWAWATPAGNHSLPACEALCAAQPGCGLVTLCPPPDAPLPPGQGCTGADHTPANFSCFGFERQALPNCTAAPGFATAVARSAPLVNVSLFTAFLGANVTQSDEFSLYPIWPTGAVEVLSSLPSAPASAASAQASSLAYSNFGSGRPVDLFSMAVRAGWGGFNSPQRVLAGLNEWLAGHQQRNMLPYVLGGGIENAGVNQAVVDMLLASSASGAPGVPPPSGLAPFVTTLFPFWPPEQAATFYGLVAKGGLALAARYNNATALVGGLAVTALAGAAGGSRYQGGPGGAAARARRCSLRSPWPGAPEGSVSVVCGGAPAAVQWADHVMTGRLARVLSFDAPVGVACAVSLQ